MNTTLIKRSDGKYEETLSEIWVVQYAEDPDSGLWTVKIFKHDVPEWQSEGFASLDESREAAHNYYDQL